MIVKLFNQPHVLYQTNDGDNEIPNAALGISIDNGGTICIEQDRSSIVIDQGTVPDLCKLLKKLVNLNINP